MKKETLKMIWQEFLLTVKMVFWLLILASVFVPFSVDFWLPV